jgi:hypothetical protein
VAAKSAHHASANERWNPTSCGRDTLAFLPNPLPGGRVVGSVVVGGPGGNLPFRSTTQWAVDSVGRIAIVHPAPYHVVFVEPSGRQRAGPIIRYDRIRLSEAHKAEWRSEQGRPRPMT